MEDGWEPLFRLAPGAVPPFTVKGPDDSAIGCALMATLGTMVVSATYRQWMLAAFCLSLLLLIYLLGRMLEDRHPPLVDTGGMQTFGDLTRAIVQHREQKGY